MFTTEDGDDTSGGGDAAACRTAGGGGVATSLAATLGVDTASMAMALPNHSDRITSRLVEAMTEAAAEACAARANNSWPVATIDPAVALTSVPSADGKVENNPARKAAVSKSARSPLTVKVAATTKRYMTPGGAGGTSGAVKEGLTTTRWTAMKLPRAAPPSAR